MASSHDSTEFEIIFSSTKFRKADDLSRTVFDIILNVSCVAIFVNKLRQLVLLTNDNLLEDIDSVLSIQLDSNQEKIIDLVARQTILGILATFANQLYNLTTFVISFYWDNNTHMHNTYLSLIFISRGFEGFCNSLILFYFFSMNSNDYYKCCGCCHRLCYGCCVRHTKNTLKRRRTTKSLKSFKRGIQL
eukprot:98967_1